VIIPHIEIARKTYQLIELSESS